MAPNTQLGHLPTFRTLRFPIDLNYRLEPMRPNQTLLLFGSFSLPKSLPKHSSDHIQTYQIQARRIATQRALIMQEIKPTCEPCARRNKRGWVLSRQPDSEQPVDSVTLTCGCSTEQSDPNTLLDHSCERNRATIDAY